MVRERPRSHWNICQPSACIIFSNADMIAAGLSPFAPETQAVTAGRLFLKEIEARITAAEDFAFETTLSGRGYLRLIERLQADGWRVELHYLALPEVSLSKARVAERVAHGGHNIPEADIDRRFPRSLHNLLHSYRMAVDTCICRMSGTHEVSLIFEQSGASITLFDQAAYEYLERQADADR
jgi:predicted ABC-type ATPase